MELEIINSSTAQLSYDYQQTQEYQSYVKSEKFLFLLHYVVVIPFFLFLLSRFLRCLRHRGWISRHSEHRMAEDMESRLTNAAAAASGLPTIIKGGAAACLQHLPSTPSSASDASYTFTSHPASTL